MQDAHSAAFGNILTSLILEIRDGVALLKLNAPPVNALTRTMNDELTSCLDRFSELDEVRAVVITGEGRTFCAGADLKGRTDVIKGPGDLPAHSRRTRECFHAIRECAKPVIAAVNGVALGAGLAIVASSDIIVASEQAAFGLPEIDVGLLGGCRHAMRLFGHSQLRRMAFAGHRLKAAELHRLGIIEECTPADGLIPAAMGIAAEIAAKSPVAIRLSKHTLNTIEQMSLRDGYRFEQDMTVQLSQTDDAKEAQAAFREKRAPIFRGR